jgi:hypothetical protein
MSQCGDFLLVLLPFLGFSLAPLTPDWPKVLFWPLMMA